MWTLGIEGSWGDALPPLHVIIPHILLALSAFWALEAPVLGVVRHPRLVTSASRNAEWDKCLIILDLVHVPIWASLYLLPASILTQPEANYLAFILFCGFYLNDLCILATQWAQIGPGYRSFLLHHHVIGLSIVTLGVVWSRFSVAAMFDLCLFCLGQPVMECVLLSSFWNPRLKGAAGRIAMAVSEHLGHFACLCSLVTELRPRGRGPRFSARVVLGLIVMGLVQALFDAHTNFCAIKKALRKEAGLRASSTVSIKTASVYQQDQHFCSPCLRPTEQTLASRPPDAINTVSDNLDGILLRGCARRV